MAVDKHAGLFGWKDYGLTSLLIKVIVLMMGVSEWFNVKLQSTKGDEVFDSDIEGRTKRIARRKKMQMYALPARYAVHALNMSLAYPLLLFAATVRALFRKVTIKSISKWAQTDCQGAYGVNPTYPCQLVFNKPFDQDKLKENFMEMCKSAEIPDDLVHVSFPDEKPNDFPDTAAMSANHYVGKQGECLGEASWGAWGLQNLGDKVIGMRCYNGDVGKPTVLWMYLPGEAWDGTSCFNFTKELINRVYGDEPQDVFMAEKLQLTPEAASKIDANTDFGKFMCRLPGNMFSNLSDFMWQSMRCMPFFGGDGFKFRYTVLNFDEDMSAKVVAGMKKQGIKPFAGVTWATATAFKNVIGHYPYGVTQQASLQHRHYTPQIKERNLVGDWLYGPQAYIAPLKREYTPMDAQASYNILIKEMGDLNGATARAIEAKAYSLLNSGAATFEFFPFYADDTRLFDSLFLNNYGLRTLHADCGFVSYNWGAPTALCFNTICVNGRMTSTLASSIYSLDVVEACRDETERLLMDFADQA